MATCIRLTRAGSKKRPFYRIVVADKRYPRDGRFIEKLGTYNPLLAKDNPDRIVLNGERIKHWLGQGASPSERVESFLVAANLFKRSKRRQNLLDIRTAKSQAKLQQKQAEEEAKKKAEEEERKAEEAAKKAEEAAKKAEEAEKNAAQADSEAAASEATPSTDQA